MFASELNLLHTIFLITVPPINSGIPEYNGQPYKERPGYEPEEAQDLEPRMLNYEVEDCKVYYEYLKNEEKERKRREKQLRKKEKEEVDE